MVSRRRFLEGLAATAVVVGFDPVGRRWVTQAEAAAGCADFAGAPPLEGVLLVDEAARAAVSTDKGNIIHRMPCAVLRPGSRDDIAAMVRYCRTHKLTVAVRGQAHTTHGQGLASGLIIENEHLDVIHELTPTAAVVDGGVRWRDLVQRSYDELKRTPPALTGYTALTVGGTLSVGGIGGVVGGLRTGLQVDHVRELDVITGRGDLRTCSPAHRRDLFEAVLAGLGQCGVITRATVDLIPAKDRARTYLFHHTDNAAHFRDFRTLLARDGLDHVYTLWFPPGTTGHVYQIQATVFYDVGAPPDDLALAGGLSAPPQIADTTYLEYVYTVDTLVDGFRATREWDRLIKPWYDVWLPAWAVEAYVGEVLPTLAARDIGSTGFIVLFPQRRSLATRPFLRLPEPDGSDWVYLFDVLTCSEQPGPDPAFTTEMMARNDRLFARARDHFGGVRYPIGSLTFSPTDWQAHFGGSWKAFKSSKQRYDPDGILAPGAGIFR